MSDSDQVQDKFFETDEHDAPTEAVADAPEKTEAVQAPVRRRRSMLDDPVVRNMTFLSIGLVLLFLVTIVSAMVTGVLGSGVASSGLQRDLTILAQEAALNPSNPAIWHLYVSALITDGQYRKAQSVIDSTSKTLNQASNQDMLTAQAELFFATKKYDKAVTTADDVRTKLKKYYDQAKKNDNSPESLGQEISDNYGQALIIKAEALSKLGRNAEAIKALDEYLKANTGAADILTRRGELKILVGDKKGAEADFRSTLKYIPGDPGALAGLKKIGVTQ